jgi:FlaA1/EpsC-like NDP-sugar epimerase
LSLPARAPVLNENPAVPPSGFFPATLAANDASSSINDVEGALGIPDLARMRPATPEIRIWDSIAQVVQDVLLLAANLYVLSYLVFLFGTPSKVTNPFTSPVPHAEVLRILFLFVTLTVLLFNMGRLYQFTRTRSALEDCQTIGWATLFATVLVSGFNYVSGTRVFPEKIIILTGLLNMATLSGWRLLKRRRDGGLPKHSAERNVLIVGAGGTGRRLAQFLEQNRQLGYRFRGFLDKDARPDPRVLGKIEQLPQVARAYFIDEVIITGLAHRQQLSGVVSTARHHRLDIQVVPDC